MKNTMLRLLKSEAEKAAARADAAKVQTRAAKAALKQARKLFKAEKKAAKQARKKLQTALAKMTRSPRARAPKPTRTAKPAGKTPAAKTPGAKPAAVKARTRVSRKPRRAAKLRGASSTEHLRSAADVAKTVIERLQSPPPALPPTPLNPPPADLDHAPEVKP